MSAAPKLPEGGQEFYYIDENGKKCDAELHARILTPVDGTIDKEKLAKIREAAQRKKARS
jgi:hypothetical protein